MFGHDFGIFVEQRCHLMAVSPNRLLNQYIQNTQFMFGAFII